MKMKEPQAELSSTLLAGRPKMRNQNGVRAAYENDFFAVNLAPTATIILSKFWISI
jgi:hypothetical protein